MADIETNINPVTGEPILPVPEPSPPSLVPAPAPEPPELPLVTGNVPADLQTLEQSGATPLQVAEYMDEYGRSYDYTQPNEYLETVGVSRSADQPYSYYRFGERNIPATVWERTRPQEQFRFLKANKQLPPDSEFVKTESGWVYSVPSTNSFIPPDLYQTYLINRSRYAEKGKAPPLHFEERWREHVTVIPYTDPSKAVTYNEFDGIHLVFRNVGGYPVVAEIRNAKGKVILKTNPDGSINQNDVASAISSGVVTERSIDGLLGEGAVAEIRTKAQEEAAGRPAYRRGGHEIIEDDFMTALASLQPTDTEQEFLRLDKTQQSDLIREAFYDAKMLGAKRYENLTVEQRNRVLGYFIYSKAPPKKQEQLQYLAALGLVAVGEPTPLGEIALLMTLAAASIPGIIQVQKEVQKAIDRAGKQGAASGTYRRKEAKAFPAPVPETMPIITPKVEPESMPVIPSLSRIKTFPLESIYSPTKVNIPVRIPRQVETMPTSVPSSPPMIAQAVRESAREVVDTGAVRRALRPGELARLWSSTPTSYRPERRQVGAGKEEYQMYPSYEIPEEEVSVGQGVRGVYIHGEGLQGLDQAIEQAYRQGTISLEEYQEYQRARKRYLENMQELNSVISVRLAEEFPQLQPDEIQKIVPMIATVIVASQIALVAIPDAQRAASTRTIVQTITDAVVGEQADTQLQSMVAQQTLTQLQTQAQVQVQPQTQTQTQAQVAAQTKTQAKTRVREQTAVQTTVQSMVAPSELTRTRAPTREAVKTREQVLMRHAPPPPPKLVLPSRGGRMRGVTVIPSGSLTWKMGMFWKYIPPPWGQSKPITLRYPPKGADVSGRTPQETLQVIGGRSARVPKSFSIDLGITDAFITNYGRSIVFTGRGTRTNVGTRIDSPTTGMSVEEGGSTYLDDFKPELTRMRSIGRPLPKKRATTRKVKRDDFTLTTSLKGLKL